MIIWKIQKSFLKGTWTHQDCIGWKDDISEEMDYVFRDEEL